MGSFDISETGISALMWVGVGLSLVFVAIRTHVQYRSSKDLYINDYFVFFAMICHIATAICYQIAIPPMYEVVNFETNYMKPGFMDRASLFLRLQYALDFLIWTTLWAVKFSLLFFFWRLFDSVQTPMRIFWWAMCAITASTWITLVVLQNFACDPIQNFFTLGQCNSERDIYYSNLIFKFSVGTDIAGDILIMIIPFPLLRKLQVNNHKRWILIGIFSLPIIPIIFAILRLVMANANEQNVDPIKFQVFSMLENTSAIITSCLPSFRLFVVNARSPSHTRSGSSRHYAHSQGHYFNSRPHGSYGTGTGKGRRGDEDSFHMQTLVEGNTSISWNAHGGGGVHGDDDSLTGLSSNGSQKEIVQGRRPTKGVMVTQEFVVQ